MRLSPRRRGQCFTRFVWALFSSTTMSRSKPLAFVLVLGTRAKLVGYGLRPMLVSSMGRHLCRVASSHPVFTFNSQYKLL